MSNLPHTRARCAARTSLSACADLPDAALRHALAHTDGPEHAVARDLVALDDALQRGEGSGTSSWDLPQALTRPALPAALLRLVRPLPWRVQSGQLHFEATLGEDDALVLHPDFVAVLDSPRLNAFHRYGTLHLSLGAEALRIDRLHTELLRRGGPGDIPEPTPEEAELFQRDGDALRLREDLYFCQTPAVLDPDCALSFRHRGGERQVRLPLSSEAARRFAFTLVPALRRSRPISALRTALGDASWSFVDRFIQAGALQVVPRTAPIPQVDPTVTMVAHSCLIFEHAGDRLMVDPMLVVRDRPRFNPLHHLDRPVDAVAITHSHWDHFNLDGLMHIHRSTPILLPKLQQGPNLINVDMAKVCAELGFTHIVPLAPWESFTLPGGMVFTALPYFGETLGPECPRDWMTFHVRIGGKRVVGLVDACADAFGDMDTVVAEVRRRFGPTDVLFAPASGFSFPQTHWTRRPFHFTLDRDTYTGGPEDVVRWARALDAATVVPYALFHTETGDVDADTAAAEADPFRAGTLAAVASTLGTAPDGLVQALRPGDALGLPPEGPATLHLG